MGGRGGVPGLHRGGVQDREVLQQLRLVRQRQGQSAGEGDPEAAFGVRRVQKTHLLGAVRHLHPSGDERPAAAPFEPGADGPVWKPSG
eukprot:8828365-Pyramimonas_sp.AAC.2